MIMNRRIILIAMAALALIATGCKKKHHPAGEPTASEITLAILDAPESEVLVGEKFKLTVEIIPSDADAGTVGWSSSDEAVAKVDGHGNVLATGSGECEISASIGQVSDKVSISVKDRNPATDKMGHSESSKTTNGQNNGTVNFSIDNTGFHGALWYQGGNNNLTYYDNGTFKVSWSGTNDLCAGVGYYYGEPGVNPDNMHYVCYFNHSKTGSGGGYNFIGIHGWTVDPLVEFLIVDDWYNKPGAALFGNRRGAVTIDGSEYDVYTQTRIQQPSILDKQTFPQYFSVRESSRQSGRIDISEHFKQWGDMGLTLGKIYEVKYYIEVGGGSGSLDCTYLFMSDGSI